MKKYICTLSLIALMMAGTILTGCGSLAVGREVGEKIITPTTMPVQIDQERLHQVSEEIIVCDVKLTILSVDRKEKTSENQGLLVITIEIENTSGRLVPINTFDFTLADSQQKTHTDAMASVEKPLGSPRLQDGETVSGMLTYRITTGEANGTLIWQPGWCTDVAYIDLQ